MSSLPEFPKFDISCHPTSLAGAWSKWVKRFENLIVALEITDTDRQRALLLHYAGEEVNEIYETLTDTDKSYDSTKAALTRYFEPKKNVTFEVYAFRQLKQDDEGKKNKDTTETIDQYLARLTEAGLRCDFHDINRELKDQIVFNCKSVAVRRKALKDDPNLDTLLKYARSIEIADSQATIIEGEAKEAEVLKVRKKAGKYSTRKPAKEIIKDQADQKTCFKCGKKWPHSGVNSECSGNTSNKTCYNCGRKWPHPGGNSNCPARGKVCRNCNMRNHFSKVCPKRTRNVDQVDNGSSEESSDDSYIDRVSSKEPRKSTTVKLKIQNRSIKMKIDTGSDVNILDEHGYQKIKDVVNLKKTKIKLHGYNSSSPLTTIGKITETVESKRKLVAAKFYVV